MTADWRDVRVGDLVQQGVLAISDGYRVRNEELGPTGIPFVRGGDIGDGAINTATIDHIRPEFAGRIQGKLSRPGDIAFITKGTVGRAGWLRSGQPPVVFAPQVAYWRVLDRNVLEPRYIYYLMRSHAFQSALDAVKTHGSMTADYVSISQQHGFQFRIPELKTQQAIAQILGKLDDKIELNRQRSETLEAIVRALFKSWFVDFDPVRAKPEARSDTLPEIIADLFPDRFVDSDFGEIPEGWGLRTIGDLAEVVGGSTPRTARDEYWAGGAHHWVTPKDLSKLSTPVLLETERKITGTGLSQISSGLLPIGTVLLSSRAPIGYLAIAEVPVAINQGFIAMKPRRGVSNLFLLHWAEAAHQQILSRANGSTFLEISRTNFRTIPIVIPNPLIMETFDRLARPLYCKVVQQEHETRTLETLRDTLLPKLMSGELRVAVEMS